MQANSQQKDKMHWVAKNKRFVIIEENREKKIVKHIINSKLSRKCSDRKKSTKPAGRGVQNITFFLSPHSYIDKLWLEI